MRITIVHPFHGHPAYKIAAETFAELAHKVAGTTCALLTDLDPLPDDGSAVVAIGSDSVNHTVAELFLSQKISDFSIRYGTDDYAIRTQELDGRSWLFMAGGRPRSTLYAVYRYFEHFCGCRWFWDGDRIPEGPLPFSFPELKESPRFEYRGLRYFAHRSLHRFQAEHWSLEDWQKEIDWIVKKRLNLFMLRIGIDDLFQRAFPEFVPYPELDKPLPEATQGYDDRNLFWSLEYRGELRKQLLAYAFQRDLMHPEDCGTMTHWYSRTPVAFLDHVKPKLLSGQRESHYHESTGLVWDINEQENLNNYFKLTDTHIREYGKPEIFHTIGLAERSYSTDREVNMRLKLNVYRRISAYLKEKYPNAPLLIASWDLWMFYTPEEVQRLVAELDPKQAILFDYTSDTLSPSNFTNWGVVGKFPWIFGIFSGYQPNSNILGYYDVTNERIRIAKDDPMCKGVVLWPELSHGDTLITEYLARNAWDQETLSVEELTGTFCQDRYAPELQATMQDIWHKFMPIVQLRAWNATEELAHHGHDTFPLIRQRAKFDPTQPSLPRRDPEDGARLQESAVQILRTLATLPLQDNMLRRDIWDIARTTLGHYVDFAIRLAENRYAEKDASMYDAMNASLALMKALRDLLATHEDYSLLESLRRLQSVTQTNPNFEKTLKNNAENTYCRAYIYENAAYLYLPEMEILFDEVKKAFTQQVPIDQDAVDRRMEENRNHFFAVPLEQMVMPEPPALARVLNRAADVIENIRFL